MKKISKDNYKIYRSNTIDEIYKIMNNKLPFPFNKELLDLLKNENKNEQEYIYIQNNNDYAFIILYKMKMNIFTFGKLKLFIKFNVIGYPCSLSNCGYYTNNFNMMIEYIKKIKGCKLILNVPHSVKGTGMIIGETLPTCMFENKYITMDDYTNSLRSQYRRRINIAINNCKNVIIKKISDNSIDIYDLYLNTYNKSNYKLEKLEKGFFDKVDAIKLVFLQDNKPVGFVLLKKNEDKLIFMLCGMDYTYKSADVYYYMLYNIILYSIETKCKYIDFGQTSEETKLKFGAYLDKRYFYVHHSNKLLNQMAKVGKGLLEYKYKFPQYRVYKEKR